ncbi:hypothetical protein ABW21_db0207536 [Orbilia brochopaga]|nr:hypothetical protein ABW21_db0207536 [Drechslerella brochopaga]
MQQQFGSGHPTSGNRPQDKLSPGESEPGIGKTFIQCLEVPASWPLVDISARSCQDMRLDGLEKHGKKQGNRKPTALTTRQAGNFGRKRRREGICFVGSVPSDDWCFCRLDPRLRAFAVSNGERRSLGPTVPLVSDPCLSKRCGPPSELTDSLQPSHIRCAVTAQVDLSRVSDCS